ncbi:MAG: ribosome maturation factor RimM [Magnetococcus sp. YQC-9]
MTNANTRWVALGWIKGAFGVRGEVRVIPSQLPIARILPDEAPESELPVDWLLKQPEWGLGKQSPPTLSVTVRSGRLHQDDLLVTFDGWEVRERIQSLAGQTIWLPEGKLPDPGVDRHYWFRLIGCRVFALPEGALPGMEQPVESVGEGWQEIGVVSDLLATGSNDVLVVLQADGEERLLPVIRDVILAVDEAQHTIRVRLMPGL